MTPEELERSYAIARDFHETYERLLPEHYNSDVMINKEVSWEKINDSKKVLLASVFADMLDRGVILDMQYSNEKFPGGET